MAFRLITVIFLLINGLTLIAQRPYPDNYPDVYDPEKGIKPFYSNDPRKPYKFGKVFDNEDVYGWIKESALYFDIKPKQVVADVGAANGFVTVAYSLFYDSVTFIIQDINKHILNTPDVNRVIKYYGTLINTSQTNNFKITWGKIKKTNLPKDSLNMILMSLTFHELKFPEAMVKDMYSKLKENGVIHISDDFSIKGIPHIVSGCNDTAYTEAEVIKIMEKNNFVLFNSMLPLNLSNENILSFKRNTENQKSVYREKNIIEEHISSLTEDSIACSKVNVNAIVKKINNHLDIYEKKRNFYSNWISEIGQKWIENNNFEAGINILKTNIELMPNTGWVNLDLGLAFYENKDIKNAELFLNNAYSLGCRSSKLIDALDDLKLNPDGCSERKDIKSKPLPLLRRLFCFD